MNFLQFFLLVNVYFSSLISSDVNYEKLLSDYRSSEEYFAIGGLFTTVAPMAFLLFLTTPQTVFSEYTKKIKPDTKKLIGKGICSLAVIANSLLTVYGLTQHNVKYNKTIVVSMILGHILLLKGTYNFAVLGGQALADQETNTEKVDKNENLASWVMGGLAWGGCGFVAYHTFGLNLFRFLNKNFLKYQLAKQYKKQ